MASIAARIAAPLRKRGFDVVKTFQIEWFAFFSLMITTFVANSKLPIRNPIGECE